MLSLTKSFEFAASHRLHKPEWSDERNAAVFGKCANPNGHGHNYRLEVSVTGQLSPETGMVIDAAKLDEVVTAVILRDVDHSNLDLDVEWLRGQITTSEVLVEAFWSRLSRELERQNLPVKLHRIRLWETSRIYAQRTA